MADMEDIETDGEIRANHPRLKYTAYPLSSGGKLGQHSDRQDSGFVSQEMECLRSRDEYFSGRNFDSVDGDLGQRLQNLKVSESSSVNIKDKRLEDLYDEGYCSKSISDSLNSKPWEIGPTIGNFPVQETCDTSQRLLSRGIPSSEAIDIYSQDEDGDTQLHMAVIQVAEPVTFYFISVAPNHEWLNLVNTLLQTPLHLAVITRQEKVVRRLMAAGASVDMRDLHGNTPLHIACREGHEEIVRCLLRPVYYEETLENKYEIPYQRIPQELEARNYDGHTFLHLAAQGTHLKIIELLLSKGAKINAQDGKSGRTVLHYAAETGNRILIEFLLKQRKININCVTYGGLTPISLAAGRGYGDVVEILQMYGADCSGLQQDDEDDSDDDVSWD